MGSIIDSSAGSSEDSTVDSTAGSAVEFIAESTAGFSRRVYKSLEWEFYLD